MSHYCPLCNILCDCGASENPRFHSTPHPSMRYLDSKARREVLRWDTKNCTHKCGPDLGENHWSCDPYQDNAYQRRLKEQENI